MNYQVVFTSHAARQVRKLDKKSQDRIRKLTALLAVNPRPPGSLKLIGKDEWRVRSGDYRMVYAIQDQILRVIIVRAGHRSDVYD